MRNRFAAAVPACGSTRTSPPSAGYTPACSAGQPSRHGPPTHLDLAIRPRTARVMPVAAAARTAGVPPLSPSGVRFPCSPRSRGAGMEGNGNRTMTRAQRIMGRQECLPHQVAAKRSYTHTAYVGVCEMQLTPCRTAYPKRHRSALSPRSLVARASRVRNTAEGKNPAIPGCSSLRRFLHGRDGRATGEGCNRATREALFSKEP
jgi:hypothetical protein